MEQRSENYIAHGTAALFLYSLEAKNVFFTFVKGCKKKQRKQNKEEYETENACGPQNLKFLLSGPLY